jgi:hypothetical protein
MYTEPAEKGVPGRNGVTAEHPGLSRSITSLDRSLPPQHRRSLRS